jgi:hypothetical protein
MALALALLGPLRVPKSLPAILSNRRVLTGLPLTGNKKAPIKGAFLLLAEREGFEPSKGF